MRSVRRVAATALLLISVTAAEPSQQFRDSLRRIFATATRDMDRPRPPDGSKMGKRLVELGNTVDFMEYPNRNHDLAAGPGTLLHVYSLISRYLMEKL